MLRSSFLGPLRSLIVLLVLANPAAAAAAPAGGPLIAVPFLPQTEALCGGAAAAMVYRYWGDRHADVQQFAPLVDREAGGIRDTALVGAIRAKGWHAEQTIGSLEALHRELDARRPVILLLEDRPTRYHFTVAVGIDDAAVVVHDPTWGPNRHIPTAVFMRAWTSARLWMLVVTPGSAPEAMSELPVAPKTASVAQTRCDRLLDAALDEIEARGLTAADDSLATVRRQCPTAAGPIRELAGVRLAQSRPKEASTLARDALRISPSDRYAWDVLGSSLFVQNDVTGALEAWNHIGKPRVDTVEIDGLTRARYSLVARILGVIPNTTLTSRGFLLADRRLEQLPDRSVSRLMLKPDTDGFAKVGAVIQETSRRPRGLAEWGSAGLQVAINREVTATIAGGTGQGEVWNGSWRWWENRPRIAGGFVAPRAGWFRGVWRVEAAWEAQTYDAGDAAPRREDRRTGMVSVRDWLAPQLRYELRAGLDVWNHTDRSILTGALLEQRLLGDRLSLTGTLDHWRALDDSDDFSAAAASVSFRSKRDPRGIVATALARVDVASAPAPLALWSGAGEGRARPTLLRAHRLLHDGVIDGPIFGRRSGSTNLELQRWWVSSMGAGAIAVFTDMAGANDRLPDAHGRAFLIDAGVGLRARLPGRPGLFRIDYGHGLRDDGQRLTAAWTVELGTRN